MRSRRSSTWVFLFWYCVNASQKISYLNTFYLNSNSGKINHTEVYSRLSSFMSKKVKVLIWNNENMYSKETPGPVLRTAFQVTAQHRISAFFCETFLFLMAPLPHERCQQSSNNLITDYVKHFIFIQTG